MSIEFQPWPKIARLRRGCVITEKIDGTNAAVGVVRAEMDLKTALESTHPFGAYVEKLGYPYIVYAQSRKRIISPQEDNYGFARYVVDNADEIARVLGEGVHFGEWWGSGIQRGYGLTNGEKRFSLFNTPRYTSEEFDLSGVPGLSTVPVLYQGPFTSQAVEYEVAKLRHSGSVAAPGFMRPEGVIVFHVASQTPYKVTLDNDDKPKGSNE